MNPVKEFTSAPLSKKGFMLGVFMLAAGDLGGMAYGITDELRGQPDAHKTEQHFFARTAMTGFALAATSGLIMVGSPINGRKKIQADNPPKPR